MGDTTSHYGQVRIQIAKCMHCQKGTPEGVLVDEIDYAKFERGAKVQQAFPYLTAGERELIMTGTHDKCFAEMFAETEEED